MTDRPITVAMIQNFIQCRSTSGLKFPNAYMGYSECDVLEITKAGYAVEWEIKLTRSDFRADFKKTIGPKRRRYGAPPCTLKHDVLCGLRGSKFIPKQFWFIAPAGIIPVDEVPDHCGLMDIVISKWGAVRGNVIRRAPVLPNNTGKIDDKEMRRLLIASNYRLWRRIGTEAKHGKVQKKGG